MPYQVITGLGRDGNDLLGTKILAHRVHNPNITSGSLLTVESNHFCVLKSRGAVLNVYETGQYELQTPDKVLLGSIVQGFYSGGSPWSYEVLYVNRAKLLVRNEGVATTLELAEVSYVVDYYIHIDTTDGALALVTHLPFNGENIDVREVADYAGPAIEQAINQVIQTTKLEDINLHIGQLLEGVKGHLSDFLKVYGIHLNDLKVLVRPKDEKIREIIALRALGLPEKALGRYYLALRMVEQGLVSAPNAAAGTGFFIGAAPAGDGGNSNGGRRAVGAPDHE
jgi:membrane protease subunit (stomatin/prohibitin family)